MDIHNGNSWILMVIDGYSWILMDIHNGYSWILMVIDGY